MRMPVLFVGHGSPMNALEENSFTQGWRDLAARIPRPKAVLCVSAHWESRGTFVLDAAQPDTIHDFYGFPQALFDVRYPAPGDPKLAQRITEIVTTPKVHRTSEWGFDHGTWSVTKFMYPNADVPTLQLSIDTSQPGAFHYALGRQLSMLRDEGVLILGSGNIVHNLRMLNFLDRQPSDWALRFDATVREHIAAKDFDDLLDWPAMGPDAALAVPTPEHYVPLLYVLGAHRPNDKISFHNVECSSALSMTCVQLG